MKKLRYGFASLGMMLSALVTAPHGALAAETPPQTAAAAPTAVFSPAQQQAIEKITHDYLLKNPQILIQVAQALQAQEQAQLKNTANTVIPTIEQKLFGNPESPVIGNPAGNITVVEFFDYQCPHCKEMAPQMNDLIRQNKNLRVVLKSLPIFGNNSEFAAKAGLAATKQGQAKFQNFYEAMLATPDRLSQDVVLKLAQKSGLNIKQLQTDMNAPAVAQEIKDNNDFARQLKLAGTPAFVIARTAINPKTLALEHTANPMLIPGAVPEAMLQEAINQVASGQNG